MICSILTCFWLSSFSQDISRITLMSYKWSYVWEITIYRRKLPDSRRIWKLHVGSCRVKLKMIYRYFLTYSVIKKGIINYFFIQLVTNFFWASKNDFRASRCWLQLAQRAKGLPRLQLAHFLCTLRSTSVFS